ncbi:MAG: sigma 54-interacting transcriptional regulator [Polyangiaceae bacterium]|nr:sigma 54-interacting transcriptional regulator [Polyangiaceae bacterium]
MSPGAPSGFEALDGLLRDPTSRGTTVVTVADSATASALAHHAARRARAARRTVVRTATRTESTARDVARRLDLDSSDDPLVMAESIGRALERDAAVVIVTGTSGAWDSEVWRLVADLDHRGHLLLFTEARPGFPLRGARTVEISAEADEFARSSLWNALEASGLGSNATLAELDELLRRAERPRPHSLPLSGSADELLGSLVLAARPWPLEFVAALGEPAALDELLDRGAVELRDELIETTGTRSDVVAPRERVAAALEQVFPRDPWALCRAAELACSARARDALMRRALSAAGDAACRSELWGRWRAMLSADAAPPECTLAVAELALELGDVEVALDFARPAATASDEFRTSFVLGRAFLARGDLVSARAALERAERVAQDDDARAAARVELAETAYARGDHDAAAHLAAAIAQPPLLRLAARNVLGKLLLARAQWDAADRHFAEDICDAITCGATTAELRARVNRAIALLSRGSREEAELLLDSVLAEGEVRGEPRAVAFALSNLAVLAIERHEHARALVLLERTTTVHRRLGDRLNFSRDIANLVELRLRLGLWEQAEQALRFGRQSLGPGAPASRLTEIGLAAARLHLARQRTLEAERELGAAMRTALQASDGDKLGECHRLAARIALDEGSVDRAGTEIAKAKALCASDYDRAEAGLLEALAARAAGQPSVEAADAAIAAARQSGDEELCREAHVLRAELALASGDAPAVLAHVQSACLLRDEIANKLDGNLRDAYLARPDLMRLHRLERLRPEVDEPPPSVEPRSVPRSRGKTGGEERYVGSDARVRALLDAAERVAPTDSTILITGESGTGKELVAELIHRASRRASGPLVKVNCAALVESLLLSELFGHEKGSFTGATGRRQGRFERAHGGTLFLDEIGDISPRTQVALLRVLEERSFERVGGTSPIAVDVRIVCATNRDLRQLVEAGQFREDLYYRLAGITLELPALRERAADLPVLCRALLERIARERGEPLKALDPGALELIGRYRWPGNVRELQNALRAASLFAVGDVIAAADLLEHVEALRRVAEQPAAPAESRRLSAIPPPTGDSASATTDGVSSVAYREIRHGGSSLSDLKRDIERDCIARALVETGGNITRAATLLGMKRPRLSQLVKQYGLTSSSEEAL